jgi:hypothetical protein
MTEFYQPDLSTNPGDPFARDGDEELVRRGFWLDMGDRSDLIDQVCLVEVLAPDE